MDVASPSCSHPGTTTPGTHPGPILLSALGRSPQSKRYKQQKQPQVGPESEEQTKVPSCSLDGSRTDPRGADSNLQPTGHATKNAFPQGLRGR